MAIALSAQYTSAIDPAFIGMVTMSMVRAGVSISFEATATPNHANRVALAKNVLANPPLYAPLFAYATASQGVDKSSVDSDINAQVDTVWNGIAGVP